MKILKLGSSGADVKKWQFFLIGQGFAPGVSDGVFGQKTHTATVGFQQKHKLYADGVVGQQTYTVALQLGLEVWKDTTDVDKTGPNWPPEPGFKPSTSNLDRQKMWGKFEGQVLANGDVKITDGWDKVNIVDVVIPQFKNVKYFPKDLKMKFHKKGVAQLQGMIGEWEQNKLTSLVKTYYGSFYPRLVRGSSTVLSNHSFGCAFDINVEWNQLGAIPALVGKEGSVRELVQIANKWGFYWGGHFPRKDGMHFEIAKLL